MSKAKLSTKGQLTIPVSVRQALGLRTGDLLSLELLEDGLLIRKPRTASSLRGTVPALKGDWRTIREAAWRTRAKTISKRSSATRTSSSGS